MATVTENFLIKKYFFEFKKIKCYASIKNKYELTTM